MASSESKLDNHSELNTSKASYNGYSYYKSHHDHESINCSVLSGDKNYDKPNELSSHKHQKDQYINDEFLFPGHGYNPIQFESQEKPPMSPEPSILKPHIGDSKKTIRERNLDEYWREQSNNTLNPNEISNFLDSFDTSKLLPINL